MSANTVDREREQNTSADHNLAFSSCSDDETLLDEMNVSQENTTSRSNQVAFTLKIELPRVFDPDSTPHVYAHGLISSASTPPSTLQTSPVEKDVLLDHLQVSEDFHGIKSPRVTDVQQCKLLGIAEALRNENLRDRSVCDRVISQFDIRLPEALSVSRGQST